MGRCDALGRGDAGLSEMPSPKCRERSRKAAPPVSLAGNCRFSAYGISDFRIDNSGWGPWPSLAFPVALGHELVFAPPASA